MSDAPTPRTERLVRAAAIAAALALAAYYAVTIWEEFR